VQIVPVINPLGKKASSDNIPFITAVILAPWLIDWVLFARIITVYPARSTPRSMRLAIIAFPLAVKAARLAVAILFTYEWNNNYEKQTDYTQVETISWAHWPLPKAELSLQLVDNGHVQVLTSGPPVHSIIYRYATAVFLWKIRSGFREEQHGRFSSGSSGEVK
jgi:hypothetical protein